MRRKARYPLQRYRVKTNKDGTTTVLRRGSILVVDKTFRISNRDLYILLSVAARLGIIGKRNLGPMDSYFLGYNKDEFDFAEVFTDADDSAGTTGAGQGEPADGDG